MFSSDPSAGERTLRSVPGMILLTVALPMPDVARAGVGRIGIVPHATDLPGWCAPYRPPGFPTHGGST